MSGLLDGIDWQGRIRVGGWVTGEGGTAPVIEKATGDTLAEIGLAGPADVRAAAARARAAQPAWAETPGQERAAILRRAAERFTAHAQEIRTWTTREGGAVDSGTGAEMRWCSERLLSTAALSTAPLGELLAPVEDELSIAQRVPIGVVGVITPWNGPVALAVRAIAPALALGNAVVLKPDTHTAVCGGVLIAALFAQAGLPEDLLQVVPGEPSVGAALVEDPDVAMISFTGSTATGRRVGEAAGRSLKRVSLELGGNNAVIVCDDADLDAVVSATSFASFRHQGQICMATGRHLVHERIAAEYRDRLVEQAERLTVGDTFREPVRLGPMISVEHATRVERIVDATVAAGATLLTGGTREERFYRPTVLDGVTQAMPAFAEEIFGPVAPLTTFASDEEAVALANATEYGLVSSIQTGDPARGLRLARRLRTGMVHVNDQTINDQHTAPMGGFGASGNATRFGAQSHLEEFTQWQWVTLRATPKRYPS